MFVKLWMQQNVITVDQEISLAEAKTILEEQRFRHLPVMDEDALVGIITQNDINRALPSPIDSSLDPHERLLASQAKVSSFMTTTPVTADPMAPLEDIALLMRKFKIGATPVVKGSKLVGIITESDIFHALIEILGAGTKGARIEVRISQNRSALYTIIDLCKQFEMELTAITIYKNFSPNQQLLTFRVTGKNLEQMVDSLWNSGAQVNRILIDSEDD